MVCPPNCSATGDGVRSSIKDPVSQGQSIAINNTDRQTDRQTVVVEMQVCVCSFVRSFYKHRSEKKYVNLQNMERFTFAQDIHYVPISKND